MKVLRLPKLEAKIGFKHSTIYKWMNEEGFPRPIPLGQKAVGWLEHEVDAWLEAQAAKRKVAA
jgi:prophage regulatory protein